MGNEDGEQWEEELADEKRRDDEGVKTERLRVGK